MANKDLSLSGNSLSKIVDDISKVKVLVVGDLILDRYIWGGVERISPEAPVPVVNVRKIEDRMGGAGNVVANLTSLGAEVSVCGYIGDDEEGKTLLKMFEEQGVNREGVVIDPMRPTTLKTRVIAQAQQVVRVDRELSDPPGEAVCEGLAAVFDVHLEKADVVIVSDYGKGTVSKALLRKVTSAINEGRLSHEGRRVILDPHPKNHQFYSHFSVVKPNRKEAEAASGISITDDESALSAAASLKDKWKCGCVLITMAEKGALVYIDKENNAFIGTEALEVFDVSGAGDTVTAVFSAALAAGADYFEAANLANIAAGIVVSEVGTVPVDVDELRKRLKA